jgi:Glycosyl hydrolase family 47.
MDLHEEFDVCLQALHDIDFSTSRFPIVNVFEITIRHLGGLISAYDLTKGKDYILLEKALELAEFLYEAFDTPNRMPQMRWQWIRWVVNAFLTPVKEVPLFMDYCWEYVNQYLGLYLGLQHCPVKVPSWLK